MTVPMFLDGALDRAAFLAYVEQMRACEPACCLHADRCGKSLIQWMSRGGKGRGRSTAKYSKLTFCYEAGPTGYGLHRLIEGLDHTCIGAAPSLIPKKAGAREDQPARCCGLG
jgi:hypothetical protein